ncbi:hypothetical protein SB778_22235 [Paraburkholderia sp. SIMBA_050]|uniref:Transposase n=1 Tax=Paraburkholderia terricola TaxID=169427 RepID=A0ABU1LRK8_9BURK|nr:hypothetical protein [Paraburkholderia terricola]MDR6409375.1 hypothetical protein [Paraburkholderia terricola]MDR6482362.1 hypothetical protein [Paraburkholderia terricola]
MFIRPVAAPAAEVTATRERRDESDAGSAAFIVERMVERSKKTLMLLRHALMRVSHNVGKPYSSAAAPAPR